MLVGVANTSNTRYVCMLKSLFQRRPRLDDLDPLVRLRALEEDEKLSVDEVTRVAREDNDRRVRLSALKRVDSIELYSEFIDDDDLGKACSQAISERIDDNHALAAHPQIWPLRLLTVEDPARVYKLACQLGSKTEAAEALVRLPVREVRDDALKLCFDEDILGEMEKGSRHQDKNVNRFVRQRLNSIKELRNRTQNLTAQAEHIIESADRSSPNDAHYLTRREKVEREWEHTLDAIAQLNANLVEFERDEIDIESLRRRFPERVDPVADDITGPQKFGAILARLKEQATRFSDIDDCEREWLDALKEHSAPRDVADQFYHLANQKRRDLQQEESKKRHTRNLRRLLEPIELKQPDTRSSDWQHVWSTRSAASTRIDRIERFLERLEKESGSAELQEDVSALGTMKSSLKQTIDQCNELEEETVRHIESNLVSLDKFVESGSLRKAKSAERNVISLINRLPKRRQSHFNLRLTPAMAAIRRLSGWQEFAEEPKRQALCESIEELVKNPLSAEEQYRRLRDLRNQWNELGILRSRSERTLQDRFDKAADEAFAVCKSWFDEQASIRANNLESRRAMCDSLRTFVDEYDWENPDFKLVHKTLRTAQSEWRTLVPVERSKAKDLNAKFNKLLKELEGHLSAHWTENQKKKEALIDEVTKALAEESTNSSELIALVKNVQAQWKAIGPAGRRHEQKLWNEFRKQCNTAFEMRETQQQERRSKIDSNINLAKDKVAAVEKILDDKETTLPQLSPTLVSDLRSEISDLELPVRIRNRLNEDLASLSSRLTQRRETLETRRTSGELLLLMDIDQEFGECEAKGEEPGAELLQRASVEGDWFVKRNAEDASKSVFALHELVLRAEVLADIPSPPEDAGKRMQVQVSRLQHGLTRGGESEEQKVEKLIQSWCTKAYGEQPLRERFQAAIRKHLQKLSKD